MATSPEKKKTTKKKATATDQEVMDSGNLPVAVDNKSEQADNIIKRYALFGTATGLIPVFGIDVAALTAIQVKMIKDLADVYEYNIDEQMMRMTITSGITSLGSRLLTGVASTLAASFSPLKMFIGGATQAALSGFMTAEIGKIYQARLSSGENPADITVGEIVNHIIAQIKEGKWNPTKVGGWQGKFGYLMSGNK